MSSIPYNARAMRDMEITVEPELYSMIVLVSGVIDESIFKAFFRQFLNLEIEAMSLPGRDLTLLAGSVLIIFA